MHIPHAWSVNLSFHHTDSQLQDSVSLDHVSHGLLGGKVIFPIGRSLQLSPQKEGTSDPHQDPFAKGSGGDLHGSWSQDSGSVAFGVQRPLLYTQCCLGQRRREMRKRWPWSQNLLLPCGGGHVYLLLSTRELRHFWHLSWALLLNLPPSVTRFAQSGRSL